MKMPSENQRRLRSVLFAVVALLFVISIIVVLYVIAATSVAHPG